MVVINLANFDMCTTLFYFTNKPRSNFPPNSFFYSSRLSTDHYTPTIQDTIRQCCWVILFEIEPPPPQFILSTKTRQFPACRKLTHEGTETYTSECIGTNSTKNTRGTLVTSFLTPRLGKTQGLVNRAFWTI